MKRICSLMLIACGLMILAGCATGPKFSSVSSTLPALDPSHGRIYIYRVEFATAAVQPDVRLDGAVVGTSRPGSFFYVDSAPGTYKIQAGTGDKGAVSIVLESGQIRYVRLKTEFDHYVVPYVNAELVDNQTGQDEIATCRYTGK